MRLIDKDALIKQAQSDGAYDYVSAHEVADAAEIDAVPVVRCGDCKYGTWLESCQRRKCDYWTCFRNGMVYGRANTVNENDFCSHGEKMEVEP